MSYPDAVAGDDDDHGNNDSGIIDRLTDAAGLADKQRLRYVDGARATDHPLVRLDDALGNWPDAFWNIDVKTDDAVEGAVEILRRHDARDRVCVAAFGWRRLRRLRRTLGPGWCTAFSQVEIVVARAATWLRGPAPSHGDAVQVPPSARGVTIVDEAFVDRCHVGGVAVHVWTVNEPNRMKGLWDIGVDAVITDDPAAAVRTRRST